MELDHLDEQILNFNGAESKIYFITDVTQNSN